MLAAIDHVQLAIPAGGEDAARAYYVGVLGMTELVKPPILAAKGGCWFRSGESESGHVEIHLGVEEPFNAAKKAHPGLLVHEIDAVAKALADHGYAVRWDDSVPDRRRFHSDDPHGNRLEFIQV